MITPLILASKSPRRAKLLEQIGIPFSIHPVHTEEIFNTSQSPEQNAARLAEEKSAACRKELPSAEIILGADTFIHFEGELIGKPRNKEDAKTMLQSFSGKKHSVITGVSLYSKEKDQYITEVCTTEVLFRTLSESEILWYLNTNEWIDAAGSYKIQEKGAVLSEKLNGSYSNVMGLPIHLIYGMLTALKYKIAAE